jgi:putative membrane protein insertion efficiency factor
MSQRILLAILDLYRRWISPALHAVFPSGGCGYQPTCSQYAGEAIAMHGARRGGWMALKRILRCHPLTRGGFDPVPLPKELPAPLTTGASHVRTLHDPLP